MIDWLKVSKSAYFYRKRTRLPKSAVTDLFRQIRQNHDSPSNNIFHHVKEPLAHAHWSAIAFYYDRDPSFLELPSRQPRERVCGFMMLVEYRDHHVVFKSGLDLPAMFKTEYFDRVGNERVERAIARADTTFEQIRLRNMATSKYALRTKTLEASDLQSVVGPSGASRYVPQGYRVRSGDDSYSATPNTGRISQRSERSGYDDLVQWSTFVIDRLLDTNPPISQFIRSFARPIDLASLPSGAATRYFAVNVADLSEELFESPDPKRLVRRTADGFEVLTNDGVAHILAALDQAFPIAIVRGTTFIKDPRNNRRVGTLVVGKTRISLRTFELPEIEQVFIEPANGPPGEDDNCVTLKRYFDRSDLFTILFSDFTLAYIDGTLYRDDQFADGGGAFLKYIRADASLNAATSEKGAFAPAQRSFELNSVFRSVVDNVSIGDDILTCDDLGDEWADFIGINGGANPKTISFYHAKHGALSLGASPFHVAVSQAMKNLGRMSLAADAMAAKLPKWSTNYANDGVQTQIPRLIRGQSATIEAKIAEARSAPDTIRRVFIVTSSLSKRQLEKAFRDIKGGAAPTPHVVQLYWLLMSFFSACLEANAFGYVVCRD
jgi:hypothetical protein